MRIAQAWRLASRRTLRLHLRGPRTTPSGPASAVAATQESPAPEGKLSVAFRGLLADSTVGAAGAIESPFQAALRADSLAVLLGQLVPGLGQQFGRAIDLFLAGGPTKADSDRTGDLVIGQPDGG